MKKYLGKISLGILCALMVCIAVPFIAYFLTPNAYEDNYQRGFVYQYRRLQNADESTPKVIVFGGSYLVFSLNTKALEEYVGRPCYELGVQTNMGKCYTIELLTESIHEGDLVVFPFEYFERDDYGMDLICLSLDGQADMTWDFFINHPKTFVEAVPRATYRRVTGVLRNKVSKAEEVYLASAFNQEYVYYELDRPEPIISEEEVIADCYAYTMDDIDPSCFELLNELNRTCEERGAKLVITFAPMCTQSVYTDEAGRAEYMDSLASNLEADIICSLDDVFYDYEYIYNDNSHLNNAGMELYTKDLADMIKDYL